MSNLSNNLGVSIIGFKAGGTIAIDRAVKLDTTAGQVVAASAITDNVIGIAQQSASANDSVPVQTYGKAKAVLGTGGATLGAELMPEAGASGKLVVAAGPTAKSCAIALEAGNAGETIAVLITGLNLKGPANS